jgi:hypothetical protein
VTRRVLIAAGCVALAGCRQPTAPPPSDPVISSIGNIRDRTLYVPSAPPGVEFPSLPNLR